MSEKIMKKIIADDIHIASIVTPNLSSEGLSFLTDDENFIQVGIWNYKKGKRLETHFHNTFSREATKTNESVYVVEGKIKCNLYFENGDFISSHIINKGEMIIQFNGAHEYFIVEDSVVIENKNGPYFGPEKDRTRI
ncbi:MAG: hypothetical protein CMC29_03485 [Flavobacteriaceae bacterium]|nr:hypothetical protein [Flavobacteriaceae bacterium]